MAAASAPFHPVILSGGSGTRLWPLSRAARPKQLIPLVTGRSMLQETALRCSGEGFVAPVVICNHEHRFAIGEQLAALDLAPRSILLEPEGRNTCPAAAVAALAVAETDPRGVVLLLPSDHAVADLAAFRAICAQALPVAQAGALVTFGITPTHPATGYGYIRLGEVLPESPGCRRVTAFVEKPDRGTAQRYLDQGGYLWNSGMFVFRADVFLGELARLEPETLEACRAAYQQARRDLDFRRLDAALFARAPARSIDHAVMERTDLAVVVPAAMGWSDVGAWSALWDIGAKDQGGNVVAGDVVAEDARGCYLRSESRLLAAVGIEDLVVVETADAVLVARKDRSEQVKALVGRLKAAGRGEHAAHPLVNRPWGSYETVQAGHRFQVKRIVVNPGAKLSLQKHFHRAEHWVVVVGTALVTRGNEQVLLHENQSTYIPLGTAHRLENPGRIPLCLIEVQSGPYLAEDDIVRLDDQYGRAAAE